jgi:hypothetical protein
VLRVVSIGTEEGAIAAAERDRKCAPPVGIEVEINHAAHLGDAYDAALDDLERATVAQEIRRLARRPHLVGGIGPQSAPRLARATFGGKERVRARAVVS